MRRRLSLCALAILIWGVSSGAALAQSVARDPRAGVGVTFSDVGELVTIGSDDALPAQIVPGVLFPIQITSHFRVEPEVGGYRNASTLTQSISVIGLTTSTTRTYTFFRAGTGAFWLTKKDRLTIYYGGRAAYLRYTQSSSGAGSFTYPTIPGKMLAPTVGGEFRLSDHFTLGAEAQVRFVTWNTSASQSSAVSSTITGDSVATHGALAVRFYF